MFCLTRRMWAVVSEGTRARSNGFSIFCPCGDNSPRRISSKRKPDVLIKITVLEYVWEDFFEAVSETIRSGYRTLRPNRGRCGISERHERGGRIETGFRRHRGARPRGLPSAGTEADGRR